MTSKYDHTPLKKAPSILRNASILALLASATGCNGTRTEHHEAPSPDPGPQSGPDVDRKSTQLNLDAPVSVQARHSIDCNGLSLVLPEVTSDMIVKDVVFAAGLNNSNALIDAGNKKWQAVFAACIRPELLKYAIFFLLGMFFSPHSAWAESPVMPKAPLLAAGGELVGYESSDPDTYFVVPNAWLLARDSQGPMASLVESLESPGSYDLRLVLAPSYDLASSTVANLIKMNPNALFFPLPSRMIEANLFLPPALGSITASLVPDKQFPSAVAVYYRLHLSGEQVEIIRSLARGNVTFQGTMTYAFATSDGEQNTSAPLTVQLEPGVLVRKTGDDRSVSCVTDMLALSELYVPRVLDGSYDLGGFIDFTLSRSVVTGSFIPGSQQLVRARDLVKNVANRSPNFRGKVTFYVEELDLPIEIAYEANLSMTLDLKTVRVDLQKFEISSVVVNGDTSTFYATLMGQLLSNQKVVGTLSRELTAELQRRILSNSLFGLGGVL
jgi:hypothetical protein